MTIETLNEANRVKKRLDTLQQVRENIERGYDENGHFRPHALTQIDALYTLEVKDTINIEDLILNYIDRTKKELYERFREI